MRVSIITATYNSSKTILDTLESLNKQTYADIEYIVVDGNSSDDTVALIKQFCPRLSKLVSEPDQGIYDALNKGIQLATGDLVGFLHSDDLFAYPDAVKDLVETIQEQDALAVYADLEYVAKDDTNVVIRKWRSGIYERRKLRFGWMPPHPTFFMRRELYQQFGLFDQTFKISADYDSVLRYLWSNNVKAAYLPQVVTRMRIGGVSNRSIRNIVSKTKEDIQVLKKHNVFWPVALLMKNLSKIPQFIKR